MRRELLAAAAMADDRPGAGASPIEPLDSRVDTAAVVAILRANKVPLVDLETGEWSRPVTGSRAWTAARDAEAAERAALLGWYREVEALLAGEGIVPVLFKSPRGLPYRSSNIDTLVRPSQMAAAAAALERGGHLRFPHYREESKLLYRRFRHGRSVISVHLHSAVSWGRVLILPGDDVADRSVLIPGDPCRVAAPEDLVLATLAHALYETDQVRLSDLRILRRCAVAPGFDWDAVIGRAGRRGWSVGLCSIMTIFAALERALYGGSSIPAPVLATAGRALDANRWARSYPRSMAAALTRTQPERLPLPLSRAHSKLHYLARLAGESSRSPDERIADLFATMWNLAANRLRLRCRPAILISVSGLDGAGKSHVCEALREAMALCEIPVRVVWSRGGFGAWMETLKRAARGTMRERLPGPGDAAGKNRWLGGRLTGAVFATLVAAEQTIALAVRVRLRLLLGISVICDRFAWDTAADLETKVGRGRAAARLAEDAMIALAPRPQLPLLLRLDPSGAAARKPGDAPIGDLEGRYAALERLARENRLEIVDAARAAEVVAGDVVDRALRRAFSRFASGAGGEP